MSVQKSISRIRLNNEDVFLLAEYETNFTLRLKILNVKESEAYKGQVNDIELRSQAANIRLPFVDFIQKATNALLQHTTDQNFLYCLDKKEETHIFKWKSIDSEETIVNLGSVEMKKRDFSYMLSEILLSLADEMQNLKTNLEHLSKELHTGKIQLSKALTNLSAANGLKENLEEELFSKFILVLNEKKRKIRELENNSRCNPCSNNNVVKRKIAKMLPVSSSETDDIDGELQQPGPSNVTKGNSLPFYKETKSVIQSKIRNRKATTRKTNCNNDDPPVISVPAKEDSGSADSLLEFL